MPKGHTNNPHGRPEGSKNERTKQWEALAESIINIHAGRFNEVLTELLTSRDPEEREKGAELYLKTLEYFKPRQARVTHAGDENHPVILHIPSDI